jgi:ribosome biogenesis GTPase
MEETRTALIDPTASDLHAWGWNEFFEQSETYVRGTKEGRKPARIVEEHRGKYVAVTERGMIRVEIAGKLRHTVAKQSGYPVIGDWVMVDEIEAEQKGIIHSVLPRKTKLSRKAAGERTEEQVLSANIDFVFIVNGLDRDFNLRRIERSLALVWNSGASPVIVLNKIDLCDDPEAARIAAEAAGNGVPVVLTQAKIGIGIESLTKYLQRGITIVFLGSSGVGKSKIINCLLEKNVQSVRELSKSTMKGRHTTTKRQMFILPGGAIVIDTPGIRELQLWETDTASVESFEDIESLALGCKFSNCRHETEPHCAVRSAVEQGTLDEQRLHNYLKLSKESAHLERKQSTYAQIEEKRKRKNLNKEKKRFHKNNDKRRDE